MYYEKAYNFIFVYFQKSFKIIIRLLTNSNFYIYIYIKYSSSGYFHIISNLINTHTHVQTYINKTLQLHVFSSSYIHTYIHTLQIFVQQKQFYTVNFSNSQYSYYKT